MLDGVAFRYVQFSYNIFVSLKITKKMISILMRLQCAGGYHRTSQFKTGFVFLKIGWIDFPYFAHVTIHLGYVTVLFSVGRPNQPGVYGRIPVNHRISQTPFVSKQRAASSITNHCHLDSQEKMNKKNLLVIFFFFSPFLFVHPYKIFPAKILWVFLYSFSLVVGWVRFPRFSKKKFHRWL